MVPYWRLFYHLVWSTKNREPLITEEVAALLQRSIRATCHEEQVLIHAIGTMPDHIHMAVSIPPSAAIGTVVGRIKGAATHVVNQVISGDDRFGWQTEYGVLSFGEKNLADVVAYVTNQAARHSAGRLWPTLEPLDPSKARSPAARRIRSSPAIDT